jgi:hypothetical protein
MVAVHLGGGKYGGCGCHGSILTRRGANGIGEST